MKVDLTNINGLADVETQVKDFEDRGKNITETPRLKTIREEMKRMERTVAEYDKADAETELPDASWEEKRRYEEGIDKEKKELQKQIAAYKKEETEILSSKEYQEDVKKQESELREERSAFYTQAKMKFEREQAKIRHEMQGILLQLGEPNVTNAADLNLQYHKYQDKLAELDRAIAMCDEQKAKVVAEFEAQAKPINDILKATYGEPEKAEETKPEGEKTEGEKTEGEKPEGEKPEGEKTEEEKKSNLPAKIIDAMGTYKSLGIWEKYKMKKAAYMQSEKVTDSESIALWRKALLMLPSKKYSEEAIERIGSGKITLPEEKIIYTSKAESTEETKEEPKTNNPWEAPKKVKEQTEKVGREAAEKKDKAPVKEQKKEKSIDEGPSK